MDEPAQKFETLADSVQLLVHLGQVGFSSSFNNLEKKKLNSKSMYKFSR